MDAAQTKMWLKHPIMAIKHKLAGMGADYAKIKQQKKIDDKIKAKEKAAKNKTKNKKGKK